MKKTGVFLLLSLFWLNPLPAIDFAGVIRADYYGLVDDSTWYTHERIRLTVAPELKWKSESGSLDLHLSGIGYIQPLGDPVFIDPERIIREAYMSLHRGIFDIDLQESVLNAKFSGTVPFTMEIDSGLAGSFIAKTGLQRLEETHRVLSSNPDIGFQSSILTVLKRMHYYFNDANPRYLAIPEVEEEQRFSALVEQYLLFYSASASPESYESLIDSAHRIVSIQGILKYRGIASITDFQSSFSRVREELPPDWTIELSGPLNELLIRQKQLERNWFLAFAAGSILIFFTVLIFFKNLKMSMISLLPSLFILLVVTGVSPILGIQIDEYTIIVVAVSTGLTIDYTIHLLNSIRSIRDRTSTGHSPSNRRQRILRYGHSLIRSGGLPVFLSFLTSIVAFSSLYLSSFTGAAHFGFLISAAIACAFFIGVFLLPLFFVPGGRTSARRHP